MNMSKLKYFLGESRKNIIRNGLMSVASLFTIVCCLLILGLFMVISLNLGVITEQIKDQCEIQVFLDVDTSLERRSEIEAELMDIDNIKTVELYTKEQILEEVKTTTFKDEPALVETFSGDDNPYSDSFKIVLDDISYASETAEEIKEIKNIETVSNKQNVVNMVVSFSKSIRNVTFVVMAVLLLIAVVIISNTVRLTVFNRRKEIGIMKYIGATDRFIRIPFIFEGIIIGFIGAMISLLLMVLSYYLILEWLEQINFSLFALVSLQTVTIWSAIVFIVAGSLIGMLGSMISIKKHLRV